MDLKESSQAYWGEHMSGKQTEDFNVSYPGSCFMSHIMFLVLLGSYYSPLSSLRHDVNIC